MKDTSRQRADLLMHLEAALILTAELGQPVTGYLIERALDEARSAQWPSDTKLRDFKKPAR